MSSSTAEARAIVVSYQRRRAIVRIAGDEKTMRVAHSAKKQIAAAAIDGVEVRLIFDEDGTIVGVERS
jgi:hypothetical protein